MIGGIAMTEPTVAPEASEEAKIGRRRLLKMVTATGGALAASSVLPGKWTKPEVHAGAVPAQTAVSPLLTISNLEVDCLRGIPPKATYRAGFYYSDSVGKVDDTATLYARATPCGEIIFDGKYSLNQIGAVVNGSGFSGAILLNFVSSGCANGTGTPEFCTILRVNRPFVRNSNEVCQVFPNCAF
jgi:hypothetical protein